MQATRAWAASPKWLHRGSELVISPAASTPSKAMIVLFCLAVALVSFTRVPMWLQVTLLFVETKCTSHVKVA